ncbi:MAG: hypothetical protein ACRBK7_17355 [Acidimicrobiales bacterium]
MSDEIEIWSVAPASDNFVANVNVLTQDAPGLDALSYLELSIETAPLFLDDLELIDQSIVQGASGQTLATMEFTGDELHYLGFYAVGSDKAVVATLTAPPDQFGAIQAEVSPYLATLSLIDPDK